MRPLLLSLPRSLAPTFVTLLTLVAVGAHADGCPSATGTDFTQLGVFIGEDFSSYPPGSLVGANFAGVDVRGAVFTGQDLTGAVFQGANLGPDGAAPASFAEADLTRTCFQDAVMNATDFSFAQFSCTDFSGTTLMEAVFGPAQTFLADPPCRSSFVEATLDVAAIDTTNWRYTDFTDADFQNVAAFSLAGRDASDAILVDAHFPNMDMNGANLTGVDFTGATLTGAVARSAALNGANLTDAQLDYVDFTCARAYYQAGDGSDLNAAFCPDTPQTSQASTGAVLQNANLKNAVLQHATFDHAQFNQANISSVDLTYASLRQASFESTGVLNAATIAGSNLSYAHLDSAALNIVVFTGALLIGASFTQTTLAGTSVSGAIMPGADFTDATLESVNFSSAVLENAVFTRATLQNIQNSGGSGVTFTCAQLGGSRFDDAIVTQATFVDAVMPPGADQCCPPAGGFTWCGTVEATGDPYGPVDYPPLTEGDNVTCPSGQTTLCTDADWQLSSDWTTSDCGTTGQSTLMWQQPPCGTPPTDVVHFADPNLEQCILDGLPGDPSAITVETAAQQQQVVCPGRGIADLGGLEAFTGLQTLDLTANQLTQFAVDFCADAATGTPCSPPLQQLKLGSNQLTQLDLGRLPNVVWLDVSDNQLASLTGTASIYFEILDASNNQLKSLDLAVQTRLLSVDLSDNQLTSVLDVFNPDLSRLTSLAYLDLSGNQLDDVGALDAIAFSPQQNPRGALRTLLLDCNPSFTCSTLALDGSYPAYQVSGCADFNAQSNQWVANVHPTCPTSAP
ncbi:MAG: pentapeptide repeat-containing protein [Acidobacteriota bacterium]